MSKPDPGMGADHIPHQGKKFTAVNPQWMTESTLFFLQYVGSFLLVQMTLPQWQT